MKKNLVFTIFFSLFVFFGIESVNAAIEGPTKDVGLDRGVRLCKYGSGAPTVELIFNNITSEYSLYYKYRKGDQWKKVSGSPSSFDRLFNMQTASHGDRTDLTGSTRLIVGWMGKDSNNPYGWKETKGTEIDFTDCPTHVLLTSNGHVYFGNSDNIGDGKTGWTRLSQYKTTNEDYMNKFYLTGNYLNNLKDEDIKKLMEGAADENSPGIVGGISTDVVANRFYRVIKDKYFKGKIDRHIGDAKLPKGAESIINEYIKKNADKIKTLLDTAESTAHESGSITDEGYQNYQSGVENSWNPGSLEVSEKPINKNTSYGLGKNFHDPVTDITCTSILTEKLTKLLKNAINFIRFLGPLLVIVFTIIDFAGAVFSADISIKKPIGKLVRRLIAAAILFFLPFIIFPLFDFLHITMAKECFSILE